MKKIIFISLCFILSCNTKDSKDTFDVYEWEGVTYASLSRSEEIDSVTGFPKFEVYRCLYCNPEESYDSKISQRFRETEDSLKIYYENKDSINIKRIKLRQDTLIKMWHEVRDSINSFEREYFKN